MKSPFMSETPMKMQVKGWSLVSWQIQSFQESCQGGVDADEFIDAGEGDDRQIMLPEGDDGVIGKYEEMLMYMV